ncbi:hypothetical protein [Brachybacterium epidermidis]|uniref:hypothetical protein n=1 Tax=Brachybacterium epidermidis TaxID=2781983 RepID=UPI00188056D8|nr:hypothetical protein [Brachybacterium epidermidis]
MRVQGTGSTQTASISFGGAGGAGGSYRSPRLNNSTVSAAANGAAEAGTRRPGSITINF